MIGNFYPAVIYAQSSFVTASPGFNPVNVRSTSAATELANDLEWIKVYW